MPTTRYALALLLLTHPAYAAPRGPGGPMRRLIQTIQLRLGLGGLRSLPTPMTPAPKLKDLDLPVISAGNPGASKHDPRPSGSDEEVRAQARKDWAAFNSVKDAGEGLAKEPERPEATLEKLFQGAGNRGHVANEGAKPGDEVDIFGNYHEPAYTFKDRVARIHQQAFQKGQGWPVFILPDVREIKIEPARHPMSLPRLFLNGMFVGYLHGTSDRDAHRIQKRHEEGVRKPLELKIEGHFANMTFYIDRLE